MKVLILSCSTGGGHNTAANAVAECLNASGHDAAVLDYMHFTNPALDRFTCSFYLFLARHAPALFGVVFEAGMAYSSLKYIKPSPVQWLYSRKVAKLGKYIEEGGYDAVLYTHVLAGEAITVLKKKGYRIPFSVFISTDYGCYPFEDEITPDYFVIGHEDLIENAVKRKVPREKILPYGIPVSMKFTALPSHEEAKEKLGFDLSRPLHLVMGGSMGAGHTLGFTERLTKKLPNDQIAVICGTNEALKAKFEKKFAGNGNVVAIGFTDRVCDYMAACDVLYTKPGGLSSTEALVVGAPIVHTASIPGCESRNIRFFRSHGLSIYAKSRRKQIAAGEVLVTDAAQKAAMLDAQKAAAKPDCATQIMHLLEREAIKTPAEKTATV